MSSETLQEPAASEIGAVPFDAISAAYEITQPASIVPVNAGETEDEALKRLGIDRNRAGLELLFVAMG